MIIAELKRYALLARKWLWLLMVGVILSTSIGLAVSIKQAKGSYSSSATVLISLLNLTNLNPLAREQNVIALIDPIIRSDVVLTPVAAQYPQVSVASLRAAIKVTSPASNNSSTILPPVIITVTVADPALAVNLANAVAQSVVNFYNQEGTVYQTRESLLAQQAQTLLHQLQQEELTLKQAEAVNTGSTLVHNLEVDLADGFVKYQVINTERSLAKNAQLERQATIEILSAATAPIGATSNIQNVLAAAALGLLLSLMVAFALTVLDDRPRTLAAVQRVAAPVLAALPAEKPARLKGADRPSRHLKAYQELATNLHLTLTPGSVTSLLLASPEADSGSAAMVARNLAYVLEQRGHRIVLVDANLTRPRLHTFFPGVKNEAGLGTVLRTMQHQQHGIPNQLPTHQITASIRLLTAGTPITDDSNLFESDAMQQLLLALSAMRPDCIIFTGAPLLQNVSTALLAGYTTHTVVTVDAGKTSLYTLQESMNRLRNYAITPAGVVVYRANDVLRLDAPSVISRAKGEMDKAR